MQHYSIAAKSVERTGQSVNVFLLLCQFLWRFWKSVLVIFSSHYPKFYTIFSKCFVLISHIRSKTHFNFIYVSFLSLGVDWTNPFGRNVSGEFTTGTHAHAHARAGKRMRARLKYKVVGKMNSAKDYTHTHTHTHTYTHTLWSKDLDNFPFQIFFLDFFFFKI